MAKIIGNTVGMGLPKPDMRQTDPTKGDYVKGKEAYVNDALTQAKTSGEFDGGYYLPSVTQPESGAVQFAWSASRDGMPSVPPIVAMLPEGPKGDTGSAGPQGIQGERGETGAAGTSVTVKSVSESTADGGSNVITFSDGKTLTVKTGSKGSTGATGPQGPAYVLTASDKAEMVSSVLASLPTWNGGSY